MSLQGLYLDAMGRVKYTYSGYGNVDLGLAKLEYDDRRPRCRIFMKELRYEWKGFSRFRKWYWMGALRRIRDLMSCMREEIRLARRRG